MDGIDLGNPLHPQTERHLEAVYWTFCDLPSWFLQKKDAWFVFAIARTKTVESLDGRTSEFCDLVLHTFFPKNGLSWSNGINLQCGDKSVTVVATFQWFLGR